MSPMARWHWDEWIWTVRNGVAALAAILLAAILSQALVFQEAALGPDGINAAAVVRLLGYGIALALIWTTAWRAAAQIPPLDAVSRLVQECLPPFATLLVLTGVYGLIHPFLSVRAVMVVSWIFVLLLLATAVWLGRTLYDNADALVIGAAAIRGRISESAEHGAQECPKCRTSNSMTAKFCTNCGASLAQAASRDDRATIGGGVRS